MTAKHNMKTDGKIQKRVALTYGYGYDHQRMHMAETNTDGDTLRQKVYVGNCEYVINGSDTTILTYLNGPLGVFGIQEDMDYSYSHRYFIHPDHLGSWTLITDNTANIQQDVAYDAWGTPYRFTTTGTEPADSLLFDRGFTGHEHLSYFDLINMNGRVYDPFTSGFLSVDNYVQSPDYTQSFNRYSYCLNNPLVYVDPSGEKWWHWAMADVLSGGFLSSTVLVTAEFAFTSITTTNLTCFPMQFATSEGGYEIQKQLSPIAFNIDFRYGTHQRGIGFNISYGIPKSLPYAKRWEQGSSYYWKNYGGYRGYEHRKGSEQSVLGVYHWGKTHYESGEFTQTVGNKSIGIPSIAGVDISNDLWGDQGDRYRTSYQRINLGAIRIDNAIFTGDPGPSGKRREYTTDMYGGKLGTYTGEGNPYDPDKYRHGVLSFGIGPLNFGADTEGIRSGIQNWFHDTKWGDAPHFRDLRGTPEYEAMGGDKFYFQFGYYRIW